MDVLALGASDCEALHGGWLGQPVNALSSLAYVVAGGYVLRRGGRRSLLPAIALGAVGAGSVLYHGPMPAGAELAHDGSLIALAVAAPLSWLRRVRGRPPTAALVAGGSAIVINLLTRTGAPLCHPDSVLQGHAAWHILTATAIALWLAPRPSHEKITSATEPRSTPCRRPGDAPCGVRGQSQQRQNGWPAGSR